MTEIILKAEHLKKVFVSGKKSMTAVDDVSFESGRMSWNRRRIRFGKEHDSQNAHTSGAGDRWTDFS